MKRAKKVQAELEFLQALSCLTAVAFTDLSIAVREVNDNLAVSQCGNDAYVKLNTSNKSYAFV